MIVRDRNDVDDLVVLQQTLIERAKGRADLLKNAMEKEQQIVDLERELKEVREAAAAEKKRLKEELAEEKCKAVEATGQFNTMSTGRSILYTKDLFGEEGRVAMC
jgi:septal ring factor EnvC (AmiA/AmiB activator)